MDATVRLHPKNARRNGVLRNVPVKILAKVTVSASQRFEVRTGEEVLPEDWDFSRQEVKRSDYDHPRKNRKHAELKSKILKYFEEGLSFDQVKSVVQSGDQEKKSLLVADLESFMDEYRKDHSTRSVTIYNSAFKTFRPFTHLSYKELDSKFFSAWRDSVRHLTHTTVHGYLCAFQQFLTWISKSGRIVNMCYKEWDVPARYRDPISLDIEDLLHFKDALITGNAAIGRDIFCIEAFCGQRISDIEAFDERDLNGTVWKFNRKKGNAKKRRQVIVNFVHFCKPALDILRKYGFKLPKVSRVTLAIWIREAGRQAGFERLIATEVYDAEVGKYKVQYLPMWQLLTTHVARKSFINLACDHGLTQEEVMDMVGIDTEAVFKKHYRGVPDQSIRIEKLKLMDQRIKKNRKSKERGHLKKVV